MTHSHIILYYRPTVVGKRLRYMITMNSVSMSFCTIISRSTLKSSSDQWVKRYERQKIW